MKVKDKRKKWLALVLAASFSLGIVSYCGLVRLDTYAIAETQKATTYQTVNFTRNGQAMYRKGMLIDGRVYVHTYLFIRNFTNATYTVSGKTLTVEGQGLTLIATEGQTYILANDRVIYTGAPAMIIGDALCVPLDALTKALGIGQKKISDTDVALSGSYNPILSGSKFYREDEVYWLSKIISAESKGEPLLGQIAVGCVVLNRVESSQFPNTIYSVIFDKKYGVQFSPTTNGTIYQTPYEISVIAAKISLEGYDMGNILYFYHPTYPGQTNWISNNRKYAFTIAGHQFYY